MSRFLISENVCMPTGNRFSLFISMLVFAAFRAYSPAKLRFYSETGKGSKGKNREGTGEGINRPSLRVTPHTAEVMELCHPSFHAKRTFCSMSFL